ncbi:MAG: efflux RND transporter periplasmic adaptor subunit, partial [Gammaproteobacteria bacterium]|nr:efflux RND transporter periplasmic adaptor subunit [Gammaproteobacteria bacterium]
FVIPTIIVASLAGAIYWKTTQQPMAGPPVMPPTVIADTRVTQENWQPTLQAIGSLVATNGINVSTEVSGTVSEIVFKSGQTVEQGQILVKLDVSVDTAALDALRAESKLSQIKFNRARDLLKKKVTSKSEFDEARAHYDAANARVKQQEAIIRRKVIRAPFSGLTGIRQVDLGQYVDAGDAIVSLQALDPIYLDYTLPERYISRIKVDQTVNIQLDAFPDQVFSGKITALNSGIDTGTRTLKIRALLANPDHLLRPGMFAQVQTITGEARSLLTLPRTAISFNTYGDYVYVINEDETGTLNVKRQPVETGESRKGRIVVNNLPLNTRVVRAGLVKLFDGATVNIDNQIVLDDAEISGE